MTWERGDHEFYPVDTYGPYNKAPKHEATVSKKETKKEKEKKKYIYIYDDDDVPLACSYFLSYRLRGNLGVF